MKFDVVKVNCNRINYKNMYTAKMMSSLAGEVSEHFEHKHLDVQPEADAIEKEAFLYTARINAAKIFSKYL